MSIDNKLKKRARDLAAQQKKEVSRLEHEAEEAQAIAIQQAAAAQTARAAHERFIQFSPRLGAYRRCPDCFVLRGVDSVLKPNIDRFVETGDDTFDEFRCRECGYKITVSDWV